MNTGVLETTEHLLLKPNMVVPGASFLGRDGAVWATDKDGLIMGLLAAEMMARTGRDPGEHYHDLTRELGEPVYERIDAPATPEEKSMLQGLSAETLGLTELAGEPVRAVRTTAGDGQPIGGVKVITEHGWWAARPSGTEDEAPAAIQDVVRTRA